MAVINTNSKALFSQAALRSTDRSMTVAMQQLSTGKRINSARDDAAGLSIATRMTHQIRSLNQAVRNAGDAINLIQTAEGATNEITDMMQRMRELAVQAVNDTNSNADRSYLDLEFQQLKQQIVQIADNTEWNGFSVLNGKAGQQVGEMPVYKVTSENQFGSVFIQPTSSRTVSGEGAGEIQEFSLDSSAPNRGTLKIGGVEVAITSSEDTMAEVADKVATTLNNSPVFSSRGIEVTFQKPDDLVKSKTYSEQSVTFQDMSAGQVFTVGGLSIIAKDTLLANDVANAFAGLTDGAEGEETATYMFVGKLAGFDTAAASDGAGTLVFKNKVEGKADPITAEGEDGKREFVIVSAADLADGETVSIAGLTIENKSGAPLALADWLDGLPEGAGDCSLQRDFAGLPSSVTITGALTDFFTGAANASGDVVFYTSSAKDVATIDITGSGSASLSATVGAEGTAVGAALTASTSQLYTTSVTFSDVSKGESITVAGMTFTANQDLTADKVAQVFLAASGATTPTHEYGDFSGTWKWGAYEICQPADLNANQLKFESSSTENFEADVGVKFQINYAASAGDVKDMPVLVGSTGMKASDIVTSRTAVTQAVENFAKSGKFLQSGSISFDIPSSAVQGDEIVGRFVNMDGETTLMTGTLADANPAAVEFKLEDGLNRSVITSKLTYTLQDPEGAGVDLSTNTRDISLSIGIEGSIPRLRDGDLLINGVNVGPTSAEDDLLSPRQNAAGSAIAKAAAINRVAVDQGKSQNEIQSITFSGTPMTGTVTVGGVSVVLTGDDYTPALAAAKIAAAMQSSPLYDSSTGRKVKYATGSASISVEFPLKEGNVEKLTVSPGATGIGSVVNTIQPYANKSAGTGVFAKVNENVLTGQAMVSGPIATGVVFVNGFASANITTVYNNSQATRDNVVRAINLISDKTGVRAINTGSDEKGISLVAVDGRNIEVRFEPTGSTTSEVLGQRIGMREGVQSATISLESKIQAPVVLSSDAAGDITRAGLVGGNYSKNQSVLNTRPRDPVQAAVAQLSSVKLQTNATAGDSVTVVVNGTQFTHDVAADATDAQKTPQFIVDSLITDINANSTLGVYATKGREVGEILLAARTPGVAFTMTATASSGATISASATDVTENRVADFRSLGMDDLEINGVKIRPTTARDDKFSNTVVSSSDPASSGLALAAAINASSMLTGVKAEANPVVSQGAITSTETPITGKQSLWVNGIEVSVNFVQNESGTDRRAKVAAAINERTGQHGVVASDNGKGVTLETDGRNLSVWFDSSQDELSAADFGLSKGGELKQISKLSVANAAHDHSATDITPVAGSAAGVYTVSFEAMEKGQTITVDGLTLFALDDLTDEDVAAAFATADMGKTPASGSKYSFSGKLTNFDFTSIDTADVTFSSPSGATLGDATYGSTVSVMINGVTIRASADQAATAAQTATALATAIEAETSLKNVSAEADDNGNILVSSDVAGSPFDIRSPEVVYSSAQTLKLSTVQENSAGKTDVSAIDMSAAYKTNVLGSVSAPVSAMDIKTLYGTVRLTAAAPNLPALPGTDGLAPDMMNINGQAIQIRSGADGFGGLSNFSQLGFNEGSFGGRASTDMDPPRVGRMAFQVGSSANQVITIDLADFGKNGPITGEITGDVDLQVDQRHVRINTREGASEVLNLLDSAMDKINATRATMGAVMNRLDHVINNLTNVSMNLSASRSSIEDADYAKASTDLAKTQIMQQAATAVLAQANTSQQSVLKLLGG